MLLLGPLGFVTPWVLAALVALPVLWVILRATPPAPRRVVFPGVALLTGLTDRSSIARRTPWWLLLMRLAAIAALILAFAAPVWRPVTQAGGDGPLLVILDAGWQAAPGWSERQARAERALKSAAADGRPAALLLAQDDQASGAIGFQPADSLIATLRAARPAAWPTALPGDPGAVLAEVPQGSLQTLWIADGTDNPNRAAWLAQLTGRGTVTVLPPARQPASLSLAPGDQPALLIHGSSADVLAIGPDPQGAERPLARLTASEDGTVPIDLQPELRNRITRYAIEGESHAGAVVLTDDRLRRRKVALVGQAAGQAEGQELLSQMHYIREALAPHADLIEGGLGDVLDAAPDVVILADQVQLAEIGELATWVDDGGLLIRFAGPRMAGFDRLAEEPLLPVALRQGGRDIGGALSWGDPRAIAPFAPDGPFAGLQAPSEVTVSAQLMAQPAPDLAEHVLAQLSDATPLVTRSGLGQGQIVLFHVTANPDWSNLPLSGLFPQMMARLVDTAGSHAAEAEGAPDDAAFWTPVSVLDGFGRQADPATIQPVQGDAMQDGPAPGRPAGIYAAGERRQALNAGGPQVAAQWPDARVEDGQTPQGRALTGPLIALAALLLALDAAGSAWIARGGRVAALLLAAFLTAPDAHAQDLDPEIVRAAQEVALAYVLTGDEAIDRSSRQGLAGLSAALRQRTSVEPGAPVGVDLDRDDLAPLVFLYWPVTDEQAAPGPQAYMRLNAFLRSGGMILFDTRDGDLSGVGGPDMSDALQRLAAPLDIPPLAQVPEDHVLTRSFYLLDDFPGRWQGGSLWVEAPPLARSDADGAPFRQLNDGVTPVVIGGNSWAEAWAIDDDGYPVFPIGQGWEGEEQRETALRFGINLIMYVLTGNYKSDQVHVPALLDRLRAEEGMR
ncbi:DUF4159 domain-containing protein [Paracoccus sp. 1_MG-2023]|uniref:DUF4159 domain-containing protein n=1 Tax=unclassified Paracoccus (in: a-proteobacteria) TaxID=2688777 RepID=UPI001C0A66DE|nr:MULTISPECIES: DUF4159 domain-containing protein [unclassified Paracoccus (in: a-proteobacteria)]MBU2958834.1 DUF4159 domain-containing protein [Paracoccus sp. C2R09]MDO6670035.1 DUF4159 domain-containing protein [Paracoccus sp. 1_MG-2023]